LKAVSGFAGLALAASALAGCGGSAAHNVSAATASSTRHAQPALRTPAPSDADVGSAPAQLAASTGAGGARHAGRTRRGAVSSTSGATSRPAVDPVTRAHHVQRARSTPSQSNDDRNVNAHGVDPCTLVTVSQARSITAGAIEGTVEAPLGPTCIYRTSAPRTEITMTVESLKLAQVTHQLSKATHITVKDHPGYCGRLGSQMLFVPLTNGQVLNVVAPCSVARQFAALALSRLAA
jgi:hypothetical protein